MGKLVPNGAYSYEVVSVDVAGNSTSASIKGITVDATKPRVFVTASDNGISPNDDGIRDEVSFSLTVENEGVESWRFSLLLILRVLNAPSLAGVTQMCLHGLCGMARLAWPSDRRYFYGQACG